MKYFANVFMMIVFGALFAAILSDFDFSRHEQHRQIVLEDRSGQQVGEATQPIDPIKIVIRPTSGRACLKIDRADFEPQAHESNSLTVYTKRICGGENDYAEAHYKAMAADGTVLDNGYTNWQVMHTSLGQRAEWPTDFRADARVVLIEVWTSN